MHFVCLSTRRVDITAQITYPSLQVDRLSRYLDISGGIAWRRVGPFCRRGMVNHKNVLLSLSANAPHIRRETRVLSHVAPRGSTDRDSRFVSLLPSSYDLPPFLLFLRADRFWRDVLIASNFP